MKPVLSSIIGLYLTTAAVTVVQPAQAQSFPPAPKGCVYLREVTTGRTFIRKGSQLAIPTPIQILLFQPELAGSIMSVD
ncbi:MAG: hypothetical protein ACP5RH_16400 [Leptodesmis sp.]|uniref:hypothetical protein n=1 Tax=Leptodesmis sp. TaxID=3100501 RepID=UPI003D1024D2